MTLHSDVAELLAGAGIVDVDLDDAVADEHVRSSAYQRVISVTASSRSRDRDRAIVATILRDPNEMTSKTAVVALVDSIAMKVSGPAEWRQWSAELLPEIDRLGTEGHRQFILRRIHDWLLCLSIEDGHVPTPVELAQATHWMQRLLAENSTSPAVLALLAESAGSRKIRNIAKNRAGTASRERSGHAGSSTGRARDETFRPSPGAGP
ncbi:hypothetical protein OKJ48_09720 [Streptomyces kunmingensis]|uniref:Uncharacterized protein n=1 Tax=Streptomyces kunmingensis TaxID=68225 RepID=A0ABU6C7E9_9ACTN|nr:hypothetical protein [Streptomyces kunmingensis]MEB3960523.1 hypothetical protein [Streptomyces kunmingensis]